MQADQVAVGVEAAGHLALRGRVVDAVRHVLFARPHQLDRRAGHLLGDQHGLARHSRRGRAGRSRRPASACRRRTLATGRPAASDAAASAASPFCVPHHTSHLSACRAPWRSSAPSVRGSGRGRRRSPRPSWPRRRSRPWRRPPCCRQRPARRRGLPSAWRRSSRWRPWRSRPRPTRSEARRARCRAPVGVGDDDDGIAVDRHDLLHAGHLLDLGGVEALELAAEHRAGPDRGVQHVRQPHVDAVDLSCRSACPACRAAAAACRRSSSPWDP